MMLGMSGSSLCGEVNMYGGPDGRWMNSRVCLVYIRTGSSKHLCQRSLFARMYVALSQTIRYSSPSWLEDR